VKKHLRSIREQQERNEGSNEPVLAPTSGRSMEEPELAAL